MADKAVVIFQMHRRNRLVDLELDLDMTAYELVQGLNQAYVLGLDTDDLSQSYLACENPIALLRGRRTLREFGVRTGSLIHFTR